MTINEKTKLLPKDYQKTYAIAIPQDDENNNTSLITTFDSCALTKAELDFFVDDPWWIKVRYSCFALCWIFCLMALVTSMYLTAQAVQQGHCSGPEEATVTPASILLSSTNAPTAGVVILSS